MSEDDIRKVVSAVLDAEAERRGKQLDDVVMKAVATILTSFGIEDDDRKELQADLLHLRKWRKSVEQAQSLTFRMVMTAIVGGLVGATWLGIKALLGK
ncbi:hypothetical protein ABIE85_001860 [Bradyrhizobium diazoefficiens]|uniref:hypothetical protein n=1 Tax=Bradyrhizobium diazoefficiens TaxID=1355477 RepID=UPI00272C2BE8|nr:hypothetical protein [Bradyrhizobium diazoefficiens]WLA60650.1 hypothetical protein QIH81_18845 [Bradyrhizobium diazoefficiens]